MDVLLGQDDIALTSSGERVMIGSIDEAVQRVRIAASVSKGSFRYRRELGVDYSGLSADDPLLKEKLELRLKEAAVSIGGVCVRVMAIDRESMTAAVSVTAGGQQRMTEVNLRGKL